MTRNPPNRRAGFTLTEIMIALAMTALLLVGISKIFALTSATISTGQAAAKAMRSQRAIQQTLSNDFLGSGPDIGSATYDGGMLPLVNTVDADYSAPFLSISNFRVATYLNAADQASSPFAPSDTPIPTANISNGTFVSRSLAMRGIDLNKDGTQNTASILNTSAGGETVPLYVYGDRNFRTDAVSFFTRGRFASQTGTDASYQSQLTANECYVWYGHLKIYNGVTSQLDITNGYGAPGDWVTPDTSTGTTPKPQLNRNNRFADQFRLGRVQSLLAPAIIGNGRTFPESSVPAENTNAVQAAGVFIGNDPTKPVRYVQRNWWSPTYPGTALRPSMTPFDVTSTVREWVNGANVQVYSDDRLNGATPPPDATAQSLSARHVRTDVIGLDIKRARQRMTYVEQNDIIDPIVNPNATSQDYWWEPLPATSWGNRYWANPFPRTSQYVASGETTNSQYAINSKSLAQRQQIVADSCSQFIVEFAGDFVTQDPVTGAPVIPAGGTTPAVPDGVLDFVVVNASPGVTVRQTRWYGMPRDVDGDGVIPGYLNGARINSTDVIPVTDFASTAANPLRAGGTGATPLKPVAKGTYTDDQYAYLLGPSIGYTFERSLPPLPPTSTNFATAIAEPAGSTNTDPDSTSYVCVWGPREFQHGTTLTAADGSTRTVYAVPQLIRVLTDIRDPDGRMKEPLTQEYVFPVRVTGAVKPLANPG